MDDWQRIVEQYGPLVWRTACRLLAHQADAADCFQSIDAVGVTLHRAKMHLRELLMSTYGNECNRR